MVRYCLSFDVGLANLAYVVVAFDQRWSKCSILDARCVNLTQLRHDRVKYKDCRLYHTNEAYDRLEHFFQEYCLTWEKYGSIERVFIERQPICGLNHVETLLFTKFRKHAIKISPNAMHKWLGISSMDYDARKAATVKLATPYLEQLRGFREVGRQHDMGDALMIMFYGSYLERVQKEKLSRKRRKTLQSKKYRTTDGKSLDEFFDQFRYSR